MRSFVIKELKNNLELVVFDYELEGFHYKIKKHNDLDVKEIVIINNDITSSLIVANFDKKYKKILTYYFNIISSGEDSDTNLFLALDEVARLKNIIMKKYHKYLKKEIEKKILKKITMLENEIKSKIVNIKLLKEYERQNSIVEEKGKSR